jgi:Na+-driven multidrug efflux pump
MTIIVGWQIMSGSYFQFIGKAKQAALLSLLRQVILFIPLLYLLPRFYGLEGIWWAGFSCDLIATVISLAVFYYYFRRLPRGKATTPSPARLQQLETKVAAAGAPTVENQALSDAGSI